MNEKSATDAQRASSVTLCVECDRQWGEEHAPECVLRPSMSYADYLRELRASRPEDYWGKYVEYLTDS